MPWRVPMPPWIARGINSLMAEAERQDVERQLMLFEDLAMTEFLESENKQQMKTERFCGKLARYLMAKALPKAWKKINELKNEEIQRAKMAAADVFSRVIEKKYRLELEKARKRFLSKEAVKYKQWVKNEKKEIHDVERFEKTTKVSHAASEAQRVAIKRYERLETR